MSDQYQNKLYKTQDRTRQSSRVFARGRPVKIRQMEMESNQSLSTRLVKYDAYITRKILLYTSKLSPFSYSAVRGRPHHTARHCGFEPWSYKTFEHWCTQYCMVRTFLWVRIPAPPKVMGQWWNYLVTFSYVSLRALFWFVLINEVTALR